MAKKKRLNKRVVVFLSILGLCVVTGAVAYGVMRLPKDVSKLLATAKEERANGHYDKAEIAYQQAISATKDAAAADSLYDLASMYEEWLGSTTMTKQEFAQKISRRDNALQTALRMNPQHFNAQKMTTTIAWSMAWKYRDPQLWENYIKISTAMLAIDPQNHLVMFRRGLANAEMAKSLRGSYIDAARSDFQAAISIKGDVPGYWISRASFEETFDPDKTEAVFSESLKVNPEKPELLVPYAQYLLEKNRQQEGLDMMMRAKAADDKAGTCLGSIALAEYYYSKKDPEIDKAMALLTAVKASHPDEYRTYRDLADMYARQSKLAEAKTVLEEGLKVLARQATTSTSGPQKLNDADALTQRQTAVYRGELNLILANVELDLIGANPEQTIAKARELVDKVPLNSLDDSRKVARINGRILFLEGKLDEAAKTLEDVFSQAPDPQVALLLTQIYTVQRMPGKANEMAKALTGMGGPQRTLIGAVLQAQSEISYRAYDEAYKNVDIALKIDPENQQAREIKTFLDITRTATLPKDAKLSDYWTVQVLEFAGQMGVGGRMKEALALVENMHAQHKDDIRVVSTLANLYLLAKQEDKAQDLLEKTSKIVKDNKNLQMALEVLREKDPKKRLELQLRDKSDLEKVMIYERSGDKDKFEEYLSKAAAQSPKDMGLIERQFLLALSDKKPNWEQQAQDCAKRAAEVDAVAGKYLLARIALSKNDNTTAMTLTQEALHDRPESKQLQVFAGQLYFLAGEMAKAEECFKDVISVDPGYGPGLVGLARVTERLGKGDEHDRLIDRAYRVVPLDPYIQSEHRRIEDDRLKPEEAIRKWEEARSANPNDTDNLLRLANLYERNKQIDRAEETYRAIFNVVPASEHLAATTMLLQFYARNAMNSRIETILIDLAQNSSDKVGAWVLHGQIRLMQDAPEQARTAFEKAIAADPKDVRGLRAMAVYFSGQGKFAEAAQEMRKVVDLDANSANRKVYAQFLINSDNLDEAAKQLDTVLAAEPKDAEAMSYKAMLLDKRGKTDQAEQMLSQAIEVNPYYLDALFRRANLRLRIDKKDEAHADLETLRKKANSPDQLRQVAMVYQRIGEQDTTIQILQQIRQRYNDYSSATLDLARIYLAQKTWVELDSLLNDAEKNATVKVAFYRIHSESYRQRNLSDKRIEKADQAYQIQKDRTTAIDLALALIEGNALDKALAFTRSQQDNGVYGPLMKALQARTLVQMKQAKEADDLFKQALSNDMQVEPAFVLEQMEKAFGPAQCVAKLEAWKDIWPKTLNFYIGFGQICSKLKTPEGQAAAVDVLNQARKMAATEQDKARIDILLGTVYQSMNDLKKAEQMYLDSLKVLGDENAPQSLNNLAYLYANDMNNPAEGIKYAARALKIMPNDIDVLDTYGWAMVKAGQLNQVAEDALSRAVAGDNSPFVCRYHLGYLYEKTNRREEARTQYKAGLDMAPSNDPMRKTIQDSYDRVSN